jgi:uncharacterized protein
MKSIKTHQRLLLFLLFVLALTCLVSPWLAVGADWFTDRWFGQSVEPYPFSRIFNRTFMISGMVLFFLSRRFLRIARVSELGLVSLVKGYRDLLIGWSIAVGSMAVLIVTMSMSDVFTPFFRLSIADSIGRCASALASGVFAGVLEEIFFRGILFKGLLDSGRPVRAFVLANLFSSLLHFVKPGEAYFVHQFDPTAGFRHLLFTFSPFFHPAPLLAGIFGLFLIGLVLSYAYLRTGDLYMAIGLHAGWVFSLKTMRVFGDFTRDDLGWMFGSTDPKIVSGVATWIGIAIVWSLVHKLTRERPGLVASRPLVAQGEQV